MRGIAILEGNDKIFQKNHFLFFIFGEISFSPHELELSLFAPINYQFYITPFMNFYFVTNDPLPLVKGVKQKVNVNSVGNSTVDRLS